MQKINGWNMLEKIFDNFPFRFLISCALGGIVYAITPNNNALLSKFGVSWYIIFIALLTFLVLSFVLWVYTFVKRILERKKENNKEIQKFEMQLDQRRKELYEITNQWSQKELNILRKWIVNENKPYRIKGFVNANSGLLGSNFVDSKQEYKSIKNKKNQENFNLFASAIANVYTIYWLKEDYYILIKLIYDKYGKLSDFDKGVNVNGKN